MTDWNDSYPGPLGEVHVASTAGGGTAITNTAAVIPLPNSNWIAMTTRNYSTAVVVKFNFNPYLLVFKTADNLATVTDYSANAQDLSTSTDVTLSSLGTAAQGDYLYVGAHLPFRGVGIDVDAANSNASILTVNYWNGTTWTDTSATDGTASGGASMAQDGSVTWTVPTAWPRATLEDIASPAPSAHQFKRVQAFWTRWQFSAALDASTTLNSMLSLNRDTSLYGELLSGQSFETRIYKGFGGVGGLEVLTDAGTANLIVNVGVRPPLIGVDLELSL